MKRGDWVIEKYTGRIGIVGNYDVEYVSVRFSQYHVALRAPEELELAPLDIQEDDIATLIDMALATKDKDWFVELNERLGELKNDKVREC